ncbi:alpha/beta hydrolase [Noviherbaspirillum cavernae]|uniref:Alpha/beta hydrolase n=1 Tax=Noviherbaspirillum cavernae TaxID=2320862 RepID=A0A418X2M4_9BURK|nr:alpha/beta hydrolase [Noviherbaspirillum cavernae]RJG06706.1 alpha/beta hydrolase [Noviherbaspirillum cavernae]
MALAMQGERVRIPAGQIEMEGMLWLPEDRFGIIVFANGGTGNRIRPPNDYVASVLRSARLGTMWLDLLTAEEAASRKGELKGELDTGVLAARLDAACEWLRQYPATRDLPLGLYGASRGAAAVLQLGGMRRGICAIVSRGGRADLAAQGILGKVSAPTLLIVGGLDEGIVEMNRAAYATLRCKKRFEIIPGATHAFDEPGSLEVVARLARRWFLRYLHPALA